MSTPPKTKGAIEVAVKLWRYYLPSENGEGWAEIVIGSNGFFAAVSDYGDYAYAWRHHGCDDVRKFFVRAARDWDYFARKLGGERIKRYDGVATREGIRKAILESRRTGDFDREDARREWRLAGVEIERSEHAFVEWVTTTIFCEPWEFRCDRVEPSLEAFCKRTMARLAAAIRAQLDQEAA